MKLHQSGLILLICSAFLYTGCGYAGPEKAVRRELDLIKKLDDDTIASFISYEDIPLSSDEADSRSDIAEAIKLFFQDFKYHIDSSSQSKDGTSASVTVSITNLDAEALAKDLCKIMYRDSLTIHSSEESDETIHSAFSLMKECMETNDYPSRKTTATFDLTNENGSWIIQESSQLENELVGGLVEYLSDPYLLEPEDILDLTLSPFRDFTADDWKNYLNTSDVFAVGTDQSDTIDQLLFQQIADFFNYEITDVVQDGDTAQVTVNITSLDLNAVMESCLGPLRDYGASTESIRASSEEVTRKTGEILITALSENTSSTITPVTVLLYNDGHTWDPVLDESFIDALLGNLDASLDSLTAAAE